MTVSERIDRVRIKLDRVMLIRAVAYYVTDSITHVGEDREMEKYLDIERRYNSMSIDDEEALEELERELGIKGGADE